VAQPTPLDQEGQNGVVIPEFQIMEEPAVSQEVVERLARVESNRQVADL